MKTVFAFSDSHNVAVPERYLDIMSESDFIFFAGDGLADIQYRLQEYKDKLYFVRGNCDGVRADEEAVIKVEDVSFLLVHGHRFHCAEDLAYRAKELGCNAVIFGHSHIFSDTETCGVRLINTGSFSRSPTDDVGYVYIVVNGKNIFVNFVKLT